MGRSNPEEVAAQVADVRESVAALEAGFTALSVKLAKLEGHVGIEETPTVFRRRRRVGPVPVAELVKGVAWIVASLGSIEAVRCAGDSVELIEVPDASSGR